LFAFVFSLGCVYLCPHLLGTFDGWVPILDFYLHGFSPQIHWYPFLTLGPIQDHKVQHWGRFKRSQFMGMIPDTKRQNQNWWPCHFTA
jgi:hypothetical protein